MSSFSPIRFGWRGARRRLGLVLIVYLASLVPALLVAVEAAEDFNDGLAHSLFAEEALAGNRWGVWNELGRDAKSDLSGALGGFYALGALGLLVQVLVAAGIVEVLLFREPRGEHPFLLGIGRHGWKFVRSALWFGGALLLLVVATGAGIAVVDEQATRLADARLQVAGWLAVVLAALVAFVPLDLGLHLSRIAAAGHADRRTLTGFLRAVAHAWRHPLRLAPLWLVFALLPGVLIVAWVVARAALAPSAAGHVAALFLAQQALFLALAFLRVGRWGAEIAYYQAIGEPRWCRRRPARQARRAGETPRPAATASSQEAPPGAVPGSEPDVAPAP
ncbi:MAG TPA: hypothetical protein VM617_06670 [Thermoanaerobaculia bacterium]|nr:hypothetical protein [Thermoanaerobaculia bacterium]